METTRTTGTTVTSDKAGIEILSQELQDAPVP